MSGTTILIVFGTAYLCWAGYLAWSWYATDKLARTLHPVYIKDGTLKPSVEEDAFIDVYKRTEGPRFGIHLFITAHIALLIGLVFIRVFNLVWDSMWQASGSAPFLEIGQWPHSTILVLIFIAMFFIIAWVSMRFYHKNTLGSLRAAIRRLNGESG